MPAAVTMEVVLGWIVLGFAAYIVGEGTSVFARAFAGLRWTGRGVKRVKGKPARWTALGLGGFFGGVYAGGFVWALGGTIFAGVGTAAGSSLVFGLTPKETLAVFLVALVAGLALYTGAAAEEAVDGD